MLCVELFVKIMDSESVWLMNNGVDYGVDGVLFNNSGNILF